MMSVPAIDIARFDTGGRRARTSMAAALVSACRDIGFFHVVGHRVGEGVIATMRQGHGRAVPAPRRRQARVVRTSRRLSRLHPLRRVRQQRPRYRRRSLRGLQAPSRSGARRSDPRRVRSPRSEPLAGASAGVPARGAPVLARDGWARRGALAALRPCAGARRGPPAGVLRRCAHQHDAAALPTGPNAPAPARASIPIATSMRSPSCIPATSRGSRS